MKVKISPKPKYKIIRLTVKQYAVRFKVTEQTVYNRIRAKVLSTEQLAPHYPHEILLQVRSDYKSL